MNHKNSVRNLFLGAIGIFVVLQLLPFGRNHQNPTVKAEPSWDSPRTRELFFSKGCSDCHSNETVWPWYSYVAPVSWLVEKDVNEGREVLNVSEWGRTTKNKGKDSAEEVEEGGMPPVYYLQMHPDTNLSEAERSEFILGLQNTFGHED